MHVSVRCLVLRLDTIPANGLDDRMATGLAVCGIRGEVGHVAIYLQSSQMLPSVLRRRAGLGWNHSLALSSQHNLGAGVGEPH